MKRIILSMTVFFGLAASGPPASAVPFDFTFTGSLVTFTIPTTASYQILAFGAQGGNGALSVPSAPAVEAQRSAATST